MIQKLIELGAKILDILDDGTCILPTAMNSNCECAWTEPRTTHETIESIDVKKNSIFAELENPIIFKAEIVPYGN